MSRPFGSCTPEHEVSAKCLLPFRSGVCILELSPGSAISIHFKPQRMTPSFSQGLAKDSARPRVRKDQLLKGLCGASMRLVWYVDLNLSQPLQLSSIFTRASARVANSAAEQPLQSWPGLKPTIAKCIEQAIPGVVQPQVG